MTEDRSCSFPECRRPYDARGWCASHYTQSKKGGPMKPIRLTLRRDGLLAVLRGSSRLSWRQPVRMSSPCWIWTGPNTGSYGAIYTAGRRWLIHRLAFEHFAGPIREGFVLDHLCENKLCFNPGHLEPVTIQENSSRGSGRRGAREA